MTPRFSPKAVSFLRALKRHNDREWFKARKEQYALLLRAPMMAVIEQLADDFRGFAPDLVASAKTSLYRIREHIAAHQELERFPSRLH